MVLHVLDQVTKVCFGRTVKVKIGNSLKEILRDEDYLKRAILEPNAEVVMVLMVE